MGQIALVNPVRQRLQAQRIRQFHTQFGLQLVEQPVRIAERQEKTEGTAGEAEGDRLSRGWLDVELTHRGFNEEF